MVYAPNAKGTAGNPAVLCCFTTMTNTNGLPGGEDASARLAASRVNTKLPDPPKAGDFLTHLPGLVPGAVVLALIIAGCLILPKWLHRSAVDDLRGVPVQTSPGIVRQLLDDPGHSGGGTVFNAVVIEINGRQVFWDLPPTSVWRPMIGELVEVHYRVGRGGSHVVHVDSVQWGTLMDTQFKKLPLPDRQ